MVVCFYFLWSHIRPLVHVCFALCLIHRSVWIGGNCDVLLFRFYCRMSSYCGHTTCFLCISTCACECLCVCVCLCVRACVCAGSGDRKWNCLDAVFSLASILFCYVVILGFWLSFSLCSGLVLFSIKKKLSNYLTIIDWTSLHNTPNTFVQVLFILWCFSYYKKF